jgi:membrane-bound metal-dependent hydrolase YbcI (DUF457 family)
VGWGVFVLLGIEKVRLIPGFTKSNPLDLYYMPYTHGLISALLWSLGAMLLYRLLRKGATARAGLVVAAAVFSHWVLDFIVHTPDLPLYGNSAKVGLGLWNYPWISFPLEVVVFFGGMWMYFSTGVKRRAQFVILGVVMFAMQLSAVFGPPPPSDKFAAGEALFAYFLFAGLIAWLERRESAAQAGAAG